MAITNWLSSGLSQHLNFPTILSWQNEDYSCSRRDSCKILSCLRNTRQPFEITLSRGTQREFQKTSLSSMTSHYGISLINLWLTPTNLDRGEWFSIVLQSLKECQLLSGLRWNMQKDIFIFDAALKTKPNTRRGTLSLTSSIYNPFGF